MSTENKDVVVDMLNRSSKRRKKMMLSVDELVPSPENRNYPMMDLDELAASLRMNGQEQPLIVTPREDGRYDILSGERRYRAALINIELGYDQFEELECIINDNELSPLERRVKVRIANVHRENIPIKNKLLITRECLNDYEEAKAAGMIPSGTLKRDWISQQTGFSPRSVQDYMNILASAEKEKIKEKKKEEPDPFLTAVQENIMTKLQTKVTVKPKKLTISYTDTEDLNRILELLNLIEE